MSEAHVETRLELLSTYGEQDYRRGKSRATTEMSEAHVETRAEPLSTR